MIYLQNNNNLRAGA